MSLKAGRNLLFGLNFFLAFILNARVNQINTDLKTWTLDEKVGQLFFLGYRSEAQLKEIKPGGVILFKWSLDDVDSTKKLTSKIKDLAAKEFKAPLFIAMDHEGGKVIRLKKGMTPMPDASAIAANMNTVTSFRAGKIMGQELSALGINTNLAPVLDLGNAKSFLQNRVWGASPEGVAHQTKYFIRGLKSAGIFSIAKHFPGHGVSSELNSHFYLPKFQKDFSKLWMEDLMPFREAIREEIEGLMTAHVAISNIDSREPASLSTRFVHDILREKMGFNGIVLTDDLEMGAVYNQGRNGSVEDLALKSLKAGTDVVLVVWSYKKQKKIRDRIIQSIKKGEILESEIDEKVQRILALKEKYLHFEPENPNWKKILRHPESMAFALEISKNAVHWETGNAQEMQSKLLNRWNENWTVVLPSGSSHYVWSKLRPQDHIYKYSKHMDDSFITKVKGLMANSQQNKQVFVVITRPLVSMNKKFITMLKEEFNSIVSQSESSRAVVWMHQGPVPLKIKNNEDVQKVGLVTLHSSSAKSLLQWAETFMKKDEVEDAKWN